MAADPRKSWLAGIRRRRKPFQPLGLGLLAVLATALIVLMTGRGVDVLVLVAISTIVIALERTLGDWLGEVLGAGWSSIILLCLIAVPLWIAFAKGGVADRFFAAAEQAGYRSVYYQTGSSQPDRSPGSPDAAVGAPDTGPADGAPTAGVFQAPADPSGSDGPIVVDNEPAFGWGGKPVTIRVHIPEMSTSGSSIGIRAHLTSEGRALMGAIVTFTVDGQNLATGTTDRTGVATATFSTRVPRSYQVRAQFAGSRQFRRASGAAILHVMPAQR